MKLRKVNAATGLEWVKLGIRTFVRQPLAISGLFFMFMAAVTLLSVVPVLGTVIAVVLTPAINLGLMAASREATLGRFPMPSLLISAFRGSRERIQGHVDPGRALRRLAAAHAGCGDAVWPRTAATRP